MKYALAEYGIHAGEQCIRRLMAKLRLITVQRLKWRKMSRRIHAHGLTNHLLDTQVEQADQVWVQDMTYLRTRHGFVYLAVVMDHYTRQILGFAMGQRMTSELMQRALLQATRQRRPKAGLIVHSDQGSQYTSHTYQQLVKQLDFIQSVTHQGNCYQNAHMESFFHSLKVEALYRYIPLTPQQMESEVAQFINHRYNTVRKHSALGYLSPNQFAQSNQVSTP